MAGSAEAGVLEGRSEKKNAQLSLKP